MLRATVSGSFHRHMDAIGAAVQELTGLGVQVLSPAEPRVVDARGDFLFVASDRVRSVRLVQDRHLESIRSCDFLWLVAPDGYVGQSAAMELGFAVATETPIFGLVRPFDLTLRQYVRIVASIVHGVKQAQRFAVLTQNERADHFLIDPHDSFEKAHHILEEMDELLKVTPNVKDTSAGLVSCQARLRNILPGSLGTKGI